MKKILMGLNTVTALHYILQVLFFNAYHWEMILEKKYDFP